MRLKALAVAGCAAVTLALATAGVAAVVNGTPGDDLLRGTEQADEVRAFAGNDAVYARGAADVIRAGTGNDGVRSGAAPISPTAGKART
jgi:Ca2+-binding RTX toxin-like protein